MSSRLPVYLEEHAGREGIVSEFLEDLAVAGSHYVTDGTLLAGKIHCL